MWSSAFRAAQCRPHHYQRSRRFALHQLPSGVFYDHITNVIGNGVSLDIGKFLKEMNELAEKGVHPRMLVSDRVQVVMPYHVLFDQYEEERLGGKSLGSTKSGIAPFYSDKYAKIGFEMCELFDEDYAYQKLKGVLEVKNVLLRDLYHKPELSADEVFENLMKQRDAIRPYVGDTFRFLRSALKEGKNILLEGQLGALKDPDYGILSHGHLVLHPGGLRRRGRGPAPLCHPRHCGGVQSLFQRRGRGRLR